MANTLTAVQLLSTITSGDLIQIFATHYVNPGPLSSEIADLVLKQLVKNEGMIAAMSWLDSEGLVLTDAQIAKLTI